MCRRGLYEADSMPWKNNFAKRQSEEERACGILPEISEADECLEDIIERFKERD